jgi:hypothetical protein
VKKYGSTELEKRFDWAHAEAAKIGFTGFSRFEQMRRDHGSVEAAKLLVVSGDFQSGFTWCFDTDAPT